MTITITEESSCDASCIAVFYRSQSDPSNDRVVTILPRGETAVTINVPDIIGKETTCFGAYAFVGTYSGLIIEDVKMRSDPIIDSDIVALAPATVTVNAGPRDGTVRIGWSWTWSLATSAELSWADREEAWESTDEPDSYIVEDRYALSWIIADLEVQNSSVVSCSGSF